MLMFDTFQLLPLSEVEKSDESASLRESVSRNEASAESRMMVVDLYSVINRLIFFSCIILTQG